MLVVAIGPQGTQTPQVYATQSTVLEALNALSQCAERRETLSFAGRALNGFSDKQRIEDATIIVKTLGNSKFSEQDIVKVFYNGRTEYHMMSQIIRLFSGLA